ncbi:MAG: hypothetical protein ACTHMX_10010, partial [Thermomicrobiales bacterium]
GNIAEIEVWGTGVALTPASTPPGTPTTTPEPTATVAPTDTPVPTGTTAPTLAATATSPTEATETLAPTATTEPTATSEPTPEIAFAPVPAWIGGTGGDGALLRQAPDPAGAILAPLSEGSDLTVTGPATGDWTPVNAQGMDGYVFSTYVVSTPPEPTPTSQPALDGQPEATTTPTPEGAGDAAIANDAPVTEDAVPTEVPATEEVLPTEVPQPVTRTLSIAVAADASVSIAQPDTPNAGEVGGVLTAGGPDGAETVLTFSVDGIGTGTVVSAQLVLTGSGSAAGSGGTLLVGYGTWFDEYGVTANQLGGLGSAGWVDTISPGSQTVIDVTGIVTADGTISFVITGTRDVAVGIGSKESGAPAYLELTIEEGGA